MTKQLFLVFSALLLAVANVLGQVSSQATSEFDSWRKYTIDKRDFSVTFPVVPVLTTSISILEGQQRKEQILKATTGELLYRVDVIENPNDKRNLKDFIDELTRTGWDLQSERSVAVNGVSGMEFVSQSKASVAQFFAANGRFYRFATSGAPADDARVKQFFSSIALGEKVDGIKIDPEPGVVYFSEEQKHVYKGSEVDQKVRLINKPPPDIANTEGIRGHVVLRTVFAANGRVVNITVVKDSPGLTERAIEAARKIKFTPAIKDGKPVSMWMQLEYNFNL